MKEGQRCVVMVPSWPNKMIDFPQLGSSRNFIKPGHWLRVNQRQDDDDHVSRIVPLLDLITNSAGQENKTFQPTPSTNTWQPTRLLVIWEQRSHSILQNIKPMHEIKWNKMLAIQSVGLWSLIPRWTLPPPSGAEGSGFTCWSNSRLLPSSIRH